MLWCDEKAEYLRKNIKIKSHTFEVGIPYKFSGEFQKYPYKIPSKVHLRKVSWNFLYNFTDTIKK